MSRPPYPASSYPSVPYHPTPGQSPYPNPGQPPYPIPGQSPYPAPGQPPYPTAGQSPYPASGQTPYPASDGSTYPTPGQPPHPSPGQSPYPTPGQPTYPSPGQSPYPTTGHSPYPSPGQSPYPTSNQSPYPRPGQMPYPTPCQPGVPPQNQQQGMSGQTAPPYPSVNQGYAGQQTFSPSGQLPHYSGQTPGSTGVQPMGDGQPKPPPPGRPPAPVYGPQAGAGETVPGVSVQGAPQYQPGMFGARQCLSKVDIHIECRSLMDRDVLSKSDPCAAVHMNIGGRWMEMGRTECIKNCLNPKFSRAIEVDYLFEEVQKIIIGVYDLDNSTASLDDDDFLGQIECTIGQIVSTNPFSKPLLMRNGRKAGNGTVIIRTEEKTETKEHLLLTFRAKNLDSKDFLGKSDPYLEIMKSCADGTWQVVKRTEVLKNTLNPSWRPFQLSLTKLCNSDHTRPLRIDCYDWDMDGSHDLIGSFSTTVTEMMKAVTNEVTWPCINPKKKAKKKSYQNSGLVSLTSVKKILEHSFLDFIMGGTQINFTVGVDFTASNGDPRQPTSLHYISQQPNEYSQAIRSVGAVCRDYDQDKLFPALGFGARLPPDWKVSHEFALNFNPQNPYCAGIEGVLGAYQNCLRHVQLYGPTNVAPIIHHVAKFAANAQAEEGSKGPHAYYILLLLTDGVLSDMDAAREAIVHASNLPMSLIIVGVGNADFTDMNILDGDDGVLRAPSGRAVKRDIVQFVPYRDFKRASAEELARQVLAEVPGQVTGYYKMRGLNPKRLASDVPQ